ncbi:MAG: hypothetical protein CM1200mP13_02800 [Candidatus Pelagibacterales bacterium]|nr:MAG: hypothetical protein CM1200mP13_02800 [Pelagibacterales bacterium]
MYLNLQGCCTGTSKALAGQLSPQEALDEVAKEWEAIVSRVGKKALKKPMLLVSKWKTTSYNFKKYFMWPLNF